jgi:hypothetical protein
MSDKEFIDNLYEAAGLEHMREALPREAVIEIIATWRRLIDALQVVKGILR